MPFDARSFEQRADPADLREWMDDPCSYEQMRDCLRDLAQVNVVTLAHRPTLAWIAHLLERTGTARPLHVLDVGCGGGDLLRHVGRWAAGRGVRLRLTGIDLNPQVIRAAEEFTAEAHRHTASDGGSIEWISGDVYGYAPSRRVDVVVSSLLTHHLREPEIVRFVRWMDTTAHFGWFVNDLYRSAPACRLFGLLSRVARWHEFVQHDGPVSIRRSFREADWKRMLSAANVPLSAAHVAREFPGRLCVGRVKV